MTHFQIKKMAFLAARPSHLPNCRLVYVIGNEIVGEGRTNRFAYLEFKDGKSTGRYFDVDGRGVHDGSQSSPSNFIRFPDMSELEVLRVLALSAPSANSYHFKIPSDPEMEKAYLRVAIYYNPRIPLDARQEELVSRFRPAKRAKI